ncbi:MAG TPA: DUF2304 domain-containing protein [Gemmataceae bacterium]|nr:DUF2304 domain-containing protein [Gemmataceae bacterium]
MTAETLMLAGGVSAFFMTVYWVRKRDLREKYAVAWLAVATLLLLCGLFPHIIMCWAEAAHLSYPSAVLFIALGIIYPFAFSVSLSLTRQYRQNVRLMQCLALLEHRVRMLEQNNANAEGEKVSEAGSAGRS